MRVIVCGLMLPYLSNGVNAACNFLGAAHEGTIIFNFDDVNVPSGASVGTVVATVGGSSGQIATAVNSSGPGNGFLRCNSGDTAVWSTTYGTIEFNGEMLIDTGIRGLAIRTSTANTSGSNGSALGAGVKFPPEHSAALTSTDISAYHYGQRKFQLIKISEVDAGIISGGVLATSTIAGKTIIRWLLTPSRINGAGCEISDYPTEISLGSVNSQYFHSPGVTANETDFTIGLACNTTQLSPVINFEGVTNDTYPTVFSNRSFDGYAQNIGVQLMQDSKIITPGTDISLGRPMSLLNQYKFSAQLFRVGDAKVTEGYIDVPVVFTVQYE